MQLNSYEHAASIDFFTYYAEEMPEFRYHVLGPRGIPLLAQSFKVLAVEPNGQGFIPVWRVSKVLCNASYLEWCVPVMAQLDLCPTMIALLM